MSDQHVPQEEPPITYEHVIGQQQLEIIMLRKENIALQQQVQQLQQLQHAETNGNGEVAELNRVGRRQAAKITKTKETAQ